MAEERLKELTAAYRRVSRSWIAQGTRAEKPRQSEPCSREAPFSAKPAAAKSASAGAQASRQGGQEKAKSRVLVPSKEHFIGYAVLLLVLLLTVLVTNFLPHRKPHPVHPNPEGKILQTDPRKVRPQQQAGAPIPAGAPSRQSSGTAGRRQESAPPAAQHVAPIGYFSVGSSQAEVLQIQGPPQKIHGQTWVYNLSEVKFKDGRVDRYNNFDGSLKVRLLPSQSSTAGAAYFTLGSTQDEVLVAQGTPTRISHDTWYYGFSQIRFRNRVVVAYDNFFGNLKVRMPPSRQPEAGAPVSFFTVGSDADEVLAVQGTPTSIQGNMWFYGFSNILFRDGRVEYVFDTSGHLRFREPDSY